jgi:PAS domain-containing protein
MRGDDLLATIEAIHAAGLDESLWPQALAATARTVGGNAATLEVFGKQSLRPVQMHSFGVPRREEIAYLARLAETNIRLPFVAEQPLDDMLWDFKIVDEGAMRRSPFYAEFLARMGMRYFVSGIVHKTADEFAAVCVHRSAKMGHIQRDGIATLRALVPHVRQAFDVARRLKRSGDARDQLERTLDWLADGVALIRADGAVVYANDSLQAMARRNDGVHLRKHGFELVDPAGQQKFNAALAAVLKDRRIAPRSNRRLHRRAILARAALSGLGTPADRGAGERAGVAARPRQSFLCAIRSLETRRRPTHCANCSGSPRRRRCWRRRCNPA